jgi:hypothetical protein
MATSTFPADMFIAWQVDAGSTTPRMITNWLKVHG